MNAKEKEKMIAYALQEYRSNGVCVIKNILNEEEVKLLQQESMRLWESQEDMSPYNVRIGIRKGLHGEDKLERLDPVADISKIFSDLNEDERVVHLATEALGVPITVLKEKLIYKWPGISGYGVHRDEPYFKVSKNGPSGIEMVSVAVALDSADSTNGAICFYPDLRDKKLSSPKAEPRDIDTRELEGESFIMPELDPGDMVLFDGIIPHCSSFNSSERSRRTYIITFVPKKYINCKDDYYQYRAIVLTKERQKKYDGEFYIR